MRLVLRYCLFSYLAVVSLRTFFTGFDLEEESILLFSISLGIIGLLLKTLTKLMSLPDTGLPYLLISSPLFLTSLYILDRFLVIFTLEGGLLSGFNVAGFVLESYEISIFWGYILAASWVAFVMFFQDWLCQGQKKK